MSDGVTGDGLVAGIDEATGAALIEIVRSAAAREILPRFRNLASDDIDTKAGPDDLVTIADRAAEAVITAEVRKLLPEALVIGEEAVSETPDLLSLMEAAKTCVVIDPVDGTSNFAAGIAAFGVILSVVERGQPVFGLLYDPVLDDWIVAHKGQGAWFVAPGHAPRRLATRPRPPAGRLQGFVPVDLFEPMDRAPVMARFAPLGPTRALRCSCHEYRTIAFGHAGLCRLARAQALGPCRRRADRRRGGRARDGCRKRSVSARTQ